MSSEIPVTPTPAAEPDAQATPQEQAEPATPQPAPQPETDWKAAYQGAQRTLNKAHQRTEQVLQQNSALFGTVESMKSDIDALLKRSMPEDELKAHEAERAQQTERSAALAATGNMHAFVIAQTGVFIDTLRAAGINPDDPTIDWARDAGNVQEWRERVGPSIAARVQRANEERIKAYDASLKAKTQKEVEAEAKALTDRQLRAAGVDKIDTGKGGRSTGSFVEKVRSIDRNTPEGEAEFQKMRKDVERGTLAI